jgi:hypothetical protein
MIRTVSPALGDCDEPLTVKVLVPAPPLNACAVTEPIVACDTLLLFIRQMWQFSRVRFVFPVLTLMRTVHVPEPHVAPAGTAQSMMIFERCVPLFWLPVATAEEPADPPTEAAREVAPVEAVSEHA